MADRSTIDRRAYLKAAGSVGVAGVLAGCADNGEEPTDDPADDDGEEETDEPADDDGEEETDEPADDDGATTVLVGPDGQFIFEPEELTIDAGTTVEFVWESDTHNLALVEGPDEGWEGYDEIEDTGFEYEHTFEVEGTYEYVCDPHETQGMYGTIIVQ